MSGIPVAVEGLKIEVQLPAKGIVSITSPPSEICKVNGKGVYFKEVEISVANITLAVLGSAVPGTVKGKMILTAQNSKTDSGAMMRVNDIAEILISQDPKHPGPGGSPTPAPIVLTVMVENAGQTIFTSL